MKQERVKFSDFIKPKSVMLAASVLLAIISVFCGIIPYLAVYRLVLALAGPNCTLASVLPCVAVATGSFILQIFFYSLSTSISHTVAFSVLEKIRLAITDKLNKMPLGYMQMKRHGFFKNLIVDEVEKLEYPLAHAIPETTSNVLLPIAVLAFLFTVDWRLALAAALPAAITLLLYLPMYMGIMNEFVSTYYDSLAYMNAKVIEYINGIKEIKIFNRAKEAATLFDESIDRYESSTLRLYKKMWRITSPTFVLLSSLLISILAVGGFLYCRGEIDFSLFLLAIFISQGIGTPLLKFIEFMDNYFEIKNGTKLVGDVLSQSELPQTDLMRVKTKGHEICFENVGFAYEEQSVLKNVSLIFKEKQKTALVGPSGSGKTTIANLIARFWDVRDGRISLGGVDIREIPLSQLMESINYVTQDTFLFNMSIRENIRIGKPDASDEEIITAACAAQCGDFIEELEDGYDTIVGDAGSRLSGGQRQRVIIARAILKNAPVLILDEATAYADMENQYKIQESLRALCKDKTLIIIAHRLSTIMDCDQIIVVNQGEIDAIGTHESLLEHSQLYRGMWEIHSASVQWDVKGATEVHPC